MLNVTGKYITVFNVEHKEKYVSANLSTYRKDQDGKYKNMYWKARFVGKAKEKAESLTNKDNINILNGIIENNYDNEKNIKWYTVVVFDYSINE